MHARNKHARDLRWPIYGLDKRESAFLVRFVCLHAPISLSQAQTQRPTSVWWRRWRTDDQSFIMQITRIYNNAIGYLSKTLRTLPHARAVFVVHSAPWWWCPPIWAFCWHLWPATVYGTRWCRECSSVCRCSSCWRCCTFRRRRSFTCAPIGSRWVDFEKKIIRNLEYHWRETKCW